MVVNKNNDTKFKFLILRILREDANILLEICKNPHSVSKERISIEDALFLYDIFEKRQLIKFILKTFNIGELHNFTAELFDHLRIGFNDEELIWVELKEINKYIEDPMRSYRMLVPRSHTIRDSFDNRLEIQYFLKTRHIHKSNEIYAIISIEHQCADIITETIEKPVLLNHIDNGKKYGFSCPSCHKEFESTPSFREFTQIKRLNE